MLRLIAAAAVLGGGLVHLQLYFRGGYRAIDVGNIGRSFAFNGIVSVVLAAVLLVRRDLVVRLAAVALVVGTLVAFVMSRNGGFFKFQEQGFHPSPQAALALLAELVALAALASSFVPALAWPTDSIVGRIAVAGAAAAVVIAIGLIAPAVWAHGSGSSSTSTAPTASGPGSGSPAASGSAVSIKGFAFEPKTITVKAGTKITWTNQDKAAHTVTAADQSYTSPKMDAGATYEHAYDTAGTFAYVCSLHPYMTASVIVTA